MNAESEETRASSADIQGGYLSSYALSAFCHRDFRILWAGTLVSNAGSWMQKIATAWLIYHITGSEAWLGIDAFASGIPTVLLLPWGGVLSDRVDRRTLLIWTNLLCAFLAFILAILQASGSLQIFHIITVSALSGMVQAAMVPASASLLPSLVEEKAVGNAIALNSIQFNLARVLGPAVGGFTLAYLGAGWSFTFNALSYLVLVGAFLFIRRVPPVHAANESAMTSFRAGLTFVRSRRDLVALLMMVFFSAFCAAPVVSMLPALVKSFYLLEASNYSMLVSSFGVGASIAAGVIATAGHQRLAATWSIIALVLLGGIQAALILFSNFGFGVALTGIAGFLFVGTMIRFGTALVQGTPDEFRGRVTSMQQFCFRSGQPLGALVAGSFGQMFGLRAVFSGMGACLALSVALVAILVRDRPRHQN